MNTKPVIDIKRLEEVIIQGEKSYSDGRHSFQYEKLKELMGELGVEIDEEAAYRRIEY